MLQYTGLRGLAALWVAIFHMHGRHLDGSIIYPFVKAGGLYGVSLFFVLSGFILTHVYYDRFNGKQLFRSTYREYMTNRLARIWPLHAFLLLFLVATYPDLVNRYSDSGTFVQHIFLVHGWGFSNLSWIGASWSISIEFFFYLIFPFLLWIGRKNKYVILVLFVSLSLVTFYEFIPYIRRLISLYAPNHEYGSLAYGKGLVHYLPYFIGGIAVWFMKNDFLARSNILTTLVLALFISTPYYFWGTVMSYFSLTLVIYSLWQKNFFSRLLCLSPIVFLGDISYSLYLLHQLLHTIFKKAVAYFDLNISAFLFWSSYWIFLIFLSYTIYKTVEVPARNYLRSRYSKPVQASTT